MATMPDAANSMRDAGEENTTQRRIRTDANRLSQEQNYVIRESTVEVLSSEEVLERYWGVRPLISNSNTMAMVRELDEHFKSLHRIINRVVPAGPTKMIAINELVGMAASLRMRLTTGVDPL